MQKFNAGLFILFAIYIAKSDLCTLAEMAGFVFDRAGGSHKIYRHPAGGMMNFQDVNGKAKPYQVKQLLDYISQNSGE